MNKNFYHYQVGSFLSIVVLRIFQLSLAWWALEDSATHFSYIIGISTFLETLTSLMFGWLGDYKSRKKIYMYSIVLSATSCASFLIIHEYAGFSFLAALIVSSLMSLSNGIRMPVQSGMIKQLVDNESISEAISQSSTFYSFANIGGPILAGFMLEMIPRSITLTLCMVCSFLALSSVWFVNYKENKKEVPQEQRILKKLFAGATVLYHTKTELYMAVFSACVNFSLFPLFTILIPTFIKLYLDSKAWNVGFIELGFSVGMLVGSGFLVGYFRKKIGKFYSILLGTIFLAFTFVNFVFVAQIPFLIVSMFLGGFGLMLYNINASIVRTTATPEGHLSRMSSSVIMIANIANPIGSVVTGILVSNYGVIEAFKFHSTVIVLLVPMFLAIPNYRSLLSINEDKLKDRYKELFPKAFVS